MEALDSHLFFTTLTYSNDFLPKCETSSGFVLPYSSTHDLQLLFKRLRNNNSFGRPFRYFAVSERGHEKGRPHFHILWFLPRYDGEDFCDGLSLEKKVYSAVLDNWVYNSGSKRKPIYSPMLSYRERFFRGKLYRNYDTHFVVPSLTSAGASSVAFYVAKYLLKRDSRERRLQQALRLNLPPSEYDYVWNLVKSTSLRSEHFGLCLTDYSQNFHIVSYLRDCVRKSDRSRGFPCYFNPDSGASFPLCKYYKMQSYIYTFYDHLDFTMDKSPIIDPDIDYTSFIRDTDSLVKNRSIVDSSDLSLEFDFLFD